MEKILKESITIGEGCHTSNFVYGTWCEVGAYNILENVYLGNFSYTGPGTIMQNVIVKNFANIAANVRIGATDHPMDRVTMHHFTYRRRMYQMQDSDDHAFFEKRHARITTIGHDTWIGHGAIIKPGLVIGHGAVVGAGAVVTKDVPPYAIVIGNQARLLRYRFDENTIKDLLSIAWWDWDYDTIYHRFDDFLLPIEQFINIYRR